MKINKKRFFGILLGLALVLGLMIGMSLAAYADTSFDYYDTSNNNIQFEKKTLILRAGQNYTIKNNYSDVRMNTQKALHDWTIKITSTGVCTISGKDSKEKDASVNVIIGSGHNAWMLEKSGSSNYEYWSINSITLNDPDYSITGSNIKYDGNSHELATGAGNSGSRYFRYRKDKGEWSSWSGNMPSATEIGTYEIQWYSEASGSSGNRFFPKGSAGSPAETITTRIVNDSAAVTTAPTAKILSYTGGAQELVTAGKAAGGTMYYAVTTRNTAPTNDNLYTTSIPAKTDAGTYYVWYKVKGDANHADISAKVTTVIIQGKVVYVKQDSDGSWPQSADGLASEIRTGSPEYFTISKSYDHYTSSGWSKDYFASVNGRNNAYSGQNLNLGEGVNIIYVYYSLDQFTLTFYEDLAGEKVWLAEKVYYGASLNKYEPTVDNSGVWSGTYQLSKLSNEMYNFGGWATEPGITKWSEDGKTQTDKAFDWTQGMPGRDVKVYPVWVVNYVQVRLDLGAWDQVAVNNADGRSGWYDKKKYDPNTPAAMPDDENAPTNGNPTSTGSYQKRSFNKSTVITAATPDHDKYLDMTRMNGATRKGYNLYGWYTASGVKWEPKYLISREYGDKDAKGKLLMDYYPEYRNYGYPLTLTARWTLKDAKVVYDVSPGASPDSGPITDNKTYGIGETITVTSITPKPLADTDTEKHEFRVWKDKTGNLHLPGDTIQYSNEKLISEYGAAESVGSQNTIKLTAVYQSISQNSLVFNSEDINIDSIIQPVGNVVSLETINSKELTRSGYTFSGWYMDSAYNTPVPDSGIAIKDVPTIIYAKWTVNRYKLTFDSNGGTSVAAIEQDYGTSVTAPAAPTRTGYTFVEWDPNIPETMPAEDMTFKALWKVNSRVVTYNTDGGTQIASETRNYGEPVVEPAKPQREGYAFSKWVYESGGSGDVIYPFAMPDDNVTVKAVWKQLQNKPDDPELQVGAVSVTVSNPATGQQYVILPGEAKDLTEHDWENAKTPDAGQLVLSGLTPNMTYTVYTRLPGDDSKEASDPSWKTVTTPKAAQDRPYAPSVHLNASSSVTVDPAIEGIEYLIVEKGTEPDGSWTKGKDGMLVFKGLKLNTEYEVYARMSENDRQNESEPSEPASVKTLNVKEKVISENTILVEKGKIETKVVTEETGEDGYSISDVVIPKEIAQALFDSLSEEDQQKVKDGATFTVSLEISEMINVSEEVKNRAEKAAGTVISDGVTGEGIFLDISLFTQLGNADKIKAEPGNGQIIKFTMQVPASLIPSEEGTNRTYILVHLLDDGSTEIAAKSKDTSFPVETDSLSSWYLTYVDEKKDNGGNEDPGENNDPGNTGSPAEKVITVSDNQPMEYSEDTRGDFRIGYFHKIPFYGKVKPEPKFFGEIKVTYNGSTCTASKIKVNKKKHLIQITGLTGADKDTVKAVKKATKGSNGLSFELNPYYVRNTDSVTPKIRKEALKSVKVKINEKDYKAKKGEFSYDPSTKVITFSGENLAGSYTVMSQ